MKKLVIFGTRAYAEIAHYYFSHDSDYTVVAFCVDGAYLEEPQYCGLPVVAAEDVVREFPPGEYEMFVAVGHQKTNSQREAKVTAVEAMGYSLAKLVSSKADVPDNLEIGPNSIVMERSIIQPFVKIGKNSVIWSASRIGFHTQIGNNCWIVSAIFGESCIVGDNTFIGLNATIAPKLTLGKANVIGAGALILKSSHDFAVYRGVASHPSRVPSNRLPNI